MVIDIPVIKDLALTASIGVAVLIFTNLLLLPVLLSYTGVSPRAAEHSLREEREETRGKGLGRLWTFLDRFTTRRWAIGAIAVSAALAIAGFAVSLRSAASIRCAQLRRFALQPRQRLSPQLSLSATSSA
jgi:predicted RND superfamily exporter protein